MTRFRGRIRHQSFLLIAGETGSCFGLVYYTDNFHDFAKVLALGGRLNWLAFMLKPISEDRLKR